jgi:hypothetical protein
MLDDGRKARLVDGNVEKGGDAPDLAGEILLQTGKMQQHDVGQLPRLPLALHMSEERPER